MPRLSSKQWEQARAEYEVRGISLGEVARKFRVNRAAISRRAKAEHWIQAKVTPVINKRVNAIKDFAETEQICESLPVTFRHTVDSVVSERLQAEGVQASFDLAIATCGLTLIQNVTSPDELETLSRVSKNIRPQLAPHTQQTTVNVSQAQQQQSVTALTPLQAMEEALRQAKEQNHESE